MTKRHVLILALSLTLFGLSIFVYKVLFLQFPLTPQTQSEKWDVEVRISFMAHNTPVKVSLFIPQTTNHHAIIDESFVSRGYGLVTKKVNENRLAVWSIRKAKGMQTLYYRAVVRQVSGRRPAAVSKSPAVEPHELEGPYLVAAESLISEIQASSADLETMVAELVQRFNNPQDMGNVTLLLGRQPSSLKKMEVAQKVLALAGIPAKVVHGILLQEFQKDVSLIHWLYVYENGIWQPFDSVTEAVAISDKYLMWWQGAYPLVKLRKGTKLETRISVSMSKEEALAGVTQLGQLTDTFFLKFSLLNLPIEAQAVYRVLLVFPIGVFLLVILRNMIGLKTFGTFMPVLIALAFRETQLLWGIVLFSIIVGFGLSIRFYLEQLKLLLVPRLAFVLIVVILLMAFFSVLTHKLGLGRGLSRNQLVQELEGDHQQAPRLPEPCGH